MSVGAPSEPPPGQGAAGERGSSVGQLSDSAIGLPLIGIILVLSPFAYVFAVDGRILGVPVIVAYVFGSWLALILAARAIAARMLRSAEGGDPQRAPRPRSPGPHGATR